MNLTTFIEYSDTHCIVLCPELGISGHGEDIRQAYYNLREAVESFFENTPLEEIEHRLCMAGSGHVNS